MSFLIAKQPIFNKEGKRVAFEVFLRKKDNMYEYPKSVPYSRATYIIMEIILEQGIDRVGEGKRVMINVSLDSLINKAIESLNPKKLIIEIIEPQIPVGEIIYRQIVSIMEKYAHEGVIFSVDESQLNNERIAGLLDKVHIISVDVKKLNQKVVEMAKAKGKTLLISKIENEIEYEKAKSVGDLFQGIYLDSPFVLKEFQTAPYLKHTLLRLMATVHTAQSPKEVANLIATDVGMSAKILRLVNSAYYSPIKEIKSLEQACAMIGLKSLKNFLLVLAMNDYMSVENPELWKKSLIRAVIAQKIAEIINTKYESDAYVIGLFSLIEEILHTDKIAFLKEVNISQEIIDGYTGKNVALRSILDYSIVLEESLKDILTTQDPTKVDAILNLEKLTGINRQTLVYIAKSAYDFAESVIRV
ncbi:MAG: HDOD domain-containing protein [Aquificaceae bacterium]|nr:HDOD domain-containing protein [Aquificaceae bacterium]MDW8422755.1 HDOD domain-containing protein [Aquificaceae bacterium]